VSYKAEVVRLALVLLIVMVGLPLAGCAGGRTKHVARGDGRKSRAPALVTHHGSVRPQLVAAVGRGTVPIERHRNAQFLSPTRLAIVTMGSTGCPSLPKRLMVQSPDAIRIRLSRPKGFCLDNLLMKRVVIAIDPKQINVHRRLTIRLYYPKGVIRRFWRPIVVVARALQGAQASFRNTGPGERAQALSDRSAALTARAWLGG